ncbi:helix-turn-helix DNA-binding protein [Gordonia phage Pupper]|uniref:Helix-turn-helix DNA-binding protein n=1 Tax=Gordonia phage Pupper TaxID=2571249 RepID=A0A4Y6EIW1_9CAUD|nr:HTH DNA binding protein [Gordonia phage Pupper]QDF18670.1 helix-turn-helix DNA-binding protein [Gordonia phage Pupper]QDF18902.1 helix-turn-helix DNA-binding protein [Gordonia phage SCentae]
MSTQLWGQTAQLRLIRARVGLSQHDLASRLGVSRRTYQLMEQGRVPVPAGLLTDLDKVLDDFTAEVEKLRAVLIEKIGETVDLDEHADAWDLSVLAAVANSIPVVVDSAVDREARQKQQEGVLR